ncbi:Putative zinc- or iron-chelating domain protein [uncultured archaeon]|nr:Putative zinc- or iron-chelating domain protein [uncultured archaeon]
MDTASLRRGIERLIHMHSSALIPGILDSGFSCQRCGWCCRENFKIRITKDIQRPSNAISIFPDDIRRIIRGTGMKWDDVAQPDTYSCLSDGDIMWAIGWILRRNEEGDCIFYRSGACAIYEWRPMICRCYPFFMGEKSVDIMRCEGLENKISQKSAGEMARMLKRYEIKKLRSYIGIMEEIGAKLSSANLHSLPKDYSGDVLVCDGEARKLRHLTPWIKSSTGGKTSVVKYT